MSRPSRCCARSPTRTAGSTSSSTKATCSRWGMGWPETRRPARLAGPRGRAHNAAAEPAPPGRVPPLDAPATDRRYPVAFHGPASTGPNRLAKEDLPMDHDRSAAARAKALAAVLAVFLTLACASAAVAQDGTSAAPA